MRMQKIFVSYQKAIKLPIDGNENNKISSYSLFSNGTFQSDWGTQYRSSETCTIYFDENCDSHFLSPFIVFPSLDGK